MGPCHSINPQTDTCLEGEAPGRVSIMPTNGFILAGSVLNFSKLRNERQPAGLFLLVIETWILSLPHESRIKVDLTGT